MGGKTALLGGSLLGGWLSLAVAPVCAQGVHFGGGFPGIPLGGPRFDGPRFDGPRPLAPLPHEPAPPDSNAPPPGPVGPEADGPPPHPPGPAERETDGPPPHPPGGEGARKCFGQAESRARVAQFRLRPPFEMMRRASHLAQAEALGGKLCRWANFDVYEISLLRADGRVVHVFLDAATGQVVPPPPH